MAGSDRRRVGAFTAACLLVSNAVGIGIFTTTGFMARDLGDPSLILALWALGGFLALMGALSYAELGAALPRVGGEYVYLRRAYGPLWGFLSGWVSFTLGFGAAIAAGAIGFAEYLRPLLPDGFPLQHPKALALGVVWTLTLLHARGIGWGGPVQIALTLLKVAAIALLIGAGLIWGTGAADPAALAGPPASPGLATGAVSLVFVLYAYSGWNAAAYIAGEIRTPGRNLPRALIGGTVFICVVYLLLNGVYLHTLSIAELAREPVLPVAEKVARRLLGPDGARIVSAMLCVSIAGSLSAMVWAGPRVYQAMASDGLLPRSLARTSAAGAPVGAILLQSVWATGLILSGSFEALIVYSGVALAATSALAVGAVLVLRRREPELPRPYRVPLYPLPPLLFIAAASGIVAYALLERPLESLAATGTILLGLPFYVFWSRRGRRSEAEPPR